MKRGTFTTCEVRNPEAVFYITRLVYARQNASAFRAVSFLSPAQRRLQAFDNPRTPSWQPNSATPIDFRRNERSKCWHAVPIPEGCRNFDFAAADAEQEGAKVHPPQAPSGCGFCERGKRLLRWSGKLQRIFVGQFSEAEHLPLMLNFEIRDVAAARVRHLNRPMLTWAAAASSGTAMHEKRRVHRSRT